MGTGILDERLNGSTGSMGSSGFDFLVFVGIGLIISCSGSWSSSYSLLGFGILGERLDGSIGLCSCSCSCSCSSSSSSSTAFIKSSSVIFSALSQRVINQNQKYLGLSYWIRII